MNPPRPGRLYWVCQAAGWGSFTAWVLGWYLVSASPIHAWDFVSIIFFTRSCVRRSPMRSGGTCTSATGCSGPGGV